MEVDSGPSAATYVPPSLSEWPNAPVLITQPDVMGSGEAREVVHIHKDGPNELSEFPIDTELFNGKIYIVIKGLPHFPESYFKGKRRLFNVVVQGQFKTSNVCFASVQTGQIFSSRLHLIPPWALVTPFQLLLEKLQPSLKMKLSGNNPYAVSPLMSTMQGIGIV